MVDLRRQKDWSDYMLIEWAAALELHQRGRVKAVLPLLVGETDFWFEAHAAFGEVQALPTQTSAATMEQVVAGGDCTQPWASEHGDGRLDGIHEPDPGDGGELSEAGRGGRNIKHARYNIMFYVDKSDGTNIRPV
jgi:hypothetical protein